MERVTDLADAYKVMGDNLIGFKEISSSKLLSTFLSLSNAENCNFVPYNIDELIKVKDSHLLILVIPSFRDGSNLKFNHFRNFFGLNPDYSEPCFYNQDWYLNEVFYCNSTLDFSWCLISKEISIETRGQIPSKNQFGSSLLSALQYTYIFFIHFVLNGFPIWQYDYIWTSDYDDSNDQIYVGRYTDINHNNKNGFSIHRHLSIKKNYGTINAIR